MLSFYNRKIMETGKRYGYKSACFDLPAGHTCPAAKLCHSRVIEIDGKRRVEQLGQFQCYAIKAEIQYPNVYNSRRENYKKTLSGHFELRMIDEIRDNKVNLVRIHSSGDFYTFGYFLKWRKIAIELPDVLFFAYSKQASFVRHNRDNPLPSNNLYMTYSMGGIHDDYARAHNLPYCQVIINDYNPNDLPVSCTDQNPVDDFKYILRGESFGIRLH